MTGSYKTMPDQSLKMMSFTVTSGWCYRVRPGDRVLRGVGSVLYGTRVYGLRCRRFLLRLEALMVRVKGIGEKNDEQREDELEKKPRLPRFLRLLRAI